MCPRALRALAPCVLSCLTCPRALRALVPYVPSRLACPRAWHTLRALRALHALVP